MTRRFVVLFAALALAACSDPAIPSRSGIYSFADTVIFGPDTTLYLYHWPATRLPVRFWTDPRSNMRFLIERAVRGWENQFLYREFSGALVTDSGDADVIVTWTDSVPPDVPPDTVGGPVNACGGVTIYDFDSTLTGPVHVQLTVFTGGPVYTAGQVQSCMRRIAMHEIGHALGLGFPSNRHSAFDEDVMYGAPLVDYPSRFDRRTVEVLYHSTPTVGPPPP